MEKYQQTQTEICPLCKSGKARIKLCKVSFVYDSIFDLVQCPDCNNRYMSPMPTEEMFVRFYSNTGYDINRWRHEQRADNYIKDLQGKRPGKFLDIGCATGYFINRIKQRTGWDVYGVELSERPALFAKNVLGLENVFHGNIFQATYPDDFFDFINIFDVLEHVPDPVKFLQECHRILKKDGVLYLIIPNGLADSIGLVRYYNKFNIAGCHPSGHVFYFPKDGLTKILHNTGFNILHAYTFGIKNGLRNLGVIPRKWNWKEFYSPRKEPEVAIEQEIIPQNKMKYPEIYYKYRYLKHRWKGIPGLHDFGLNYRVILQPVKS